VDINSAVGRKNGLSRNELAMITSGGVEGFSESERLLLQLADAMSGTPANVTDALFTSLRQFFSEEQLIEMAAVVAQENYRARLNRVFDVKSQGFYHTGPVEQKAAS
jgi:alkylhydroperoxidase family enzyme